MSDPWPRFLAKVDFDPPESDCWLWIGSGSSNGYGHLWLDGRYVSAHRLSYQLFVGPIPDGLVIDHLCRIRRCVNPAHLEAVTQSVNVLRGTSPSAQRKRHASVTACPEGHEYTRSNTRTTVQNGYPKRHCRKCDGLRPLEESEVA